MMAKEKSERKSAIIARDEEGNYIVDSEDNILCICEDDTEFHIPRDCVDSNATTMICVVDDVEVELLLNDSNPEEEVEISKPNNSKKTLTAVIRPSENNPKTEKSPAMSAVGSFAWTDKPTRHFLTLYKENKEFMSEGKIKTCKEMWKEISTRMIEAGYEVTPLQVENKFKTLERAYKKSQYRKSKKSNRHRISCSYERELSDLLRSKHSVDPLAISAREGLRTRSDAIFSKNEHLQQSKFQFIPHAESTMDCTDETIDNNEDTMIVNIAPWMKKKLNVEETAKSLAMCQKAIEDLTADRREQRSEFLELMRTMVEQREVANKQRERKNLLLERLITVMEEKNTQPKT